MPKSLTLVDRPAMPLVDSPYFDSKEAMSYLRLKYQQQLQHLIKEHGLPTLRCGGRLRFDRRELDAWLRGTTALELRRRK